jgi:predicted transcriptional regulator
MEDGAGKLVCQELCPIPTMDETPVKEAGLNNINMDEEVEVVQKESKPTILGRNSCNDELRVTLQDGRRLH